MSAKLRLVYPRKVLKVSRRNVEIYLGTKTSEARRVNPLLSDQIWIG